jgi:hypothetical protein
LPWKAFFSNAVDWCDHECETADWKKKPKELKELLKMKLGDTDACFEGIHVHLPAFKQVGLWRSVVYCFPKPLTL